MMNTQTQATFKKELLAFTRTKKFLILFLVYMGFSILDPFLLKGLGILTEWSNAALEGSGVEMPSITDDIFNSSAAALSGTISDLCANALLVYLIVINSFAGGEQKKRSIIIPRSAGLSSFSYLFPKFIVYPLAIFIFAVLGSFVSWCTASMIFEKKDAVINGVLLGGILAGVYLMMYVCLHLALGTITGRAGMSSAICICASYLLPSAFATADLSLVYNPLTINLIASSAPYKSFFSDGANSLSSLDIIITIAFAFAVMVIVFLLALFAQNAKRIDNSGNEMNI